MRARASATTERSRSAIVSCSCSPWRGWCVWVSRSMQSIDESPTGFRALTTGRTKVAGKAAGKKRRQARTEPRAFWPLRPRPAYVPWPEPGPPPAPMIGHVTSSYPSPTAGRSIAMAMVRGGHGLHGETVYIPMPGRVIPAKVTKPVFFDPEGARLDG